MKRVQKFTLIFILFGVTTLSIIFIIGFNWGTKSASLNEKFTLDFEETVNIAQTGLNIKLVEMIHEDNKDGPKNYCVYEILFNGVFSSAIRSIKGQTNTFEGYRITQVEEGCTFIVSK